jgi:UDP-glucose 4-epimerase
MNYLITGGSGFIGSHLSEFLLSQRHRVAVIDDLSTGSAANVAHLRANPNFSCIFASLFDRSLTAELVDDADIIVHLAASVGVKLIVQSPVRTIETNILGTEHILKLAAKKGKKVIITSTSEIYGKSSKMPFCEDDDMVFGPSIRSRWSYACSKAIDEFLGLAYYREKGTPVIIVRLFNTVGPRQTGHYGMVLPRFVRQALHSEPITVYGDGTQRRCFSYVGDIVGAIYRLTQEPRAIGEIFNLGTDREVSINQLAELVLEITLSHSKIIHIPYSEAYGEGFEDMPRRVPSLEKVRGLIGYRPTLELREIVEKVANYMSSKPEANNFLFTETAALYPSQYSRS